MSITFLDCNCSIGRTNVPNPGTFDSPEILVEKMAEYGIAESLVYHAVARDHTPAMGNPLIDEIASKYENINPVWVIMPHHTGEFPKPDILWAEMKNKGVRAVRIFPSDKRHNYSMKGYSLGPLLSMLDEHSVPLFVDIDEIGWDKIDIIPDRYPKLPIVLCNIGYRCDRHLYPLMESCGNIHIETSRYIPNQGIEALVEEFGSDRILFGSAMPYYSGAGAVFHIRNLMLPEEDKKAIASENVKRLLSEVE